MLTNRNNKRSEKNWEDAVNTKIDNLLVVSQKGFRCRIYKDLLEAIEDNDPVLSEVDLSNCNLIAADMVVLKKSFQKKDNENITTLNLGHNDIGDDGVKALLEVLKKSNITTLNLCNNNIWLKGAKALAKFLKVNKDITTLDLGFNYIGDDGVKALLEGLKESNITTLNLRLNRIGVEGAKALAEFLKVNKSITTLNLRDNDIGDDGVKALQKA